MITILKTSYLDQTQTIGLNTILEYSGIFIVVAVEGCLKMVLNSTAPSIGFAGTGPEAKFDSNQPSIGFRGRCVNANSN